ncbi:hypothetical protein SVIO_104220 [Streptomyces violaceusniger]|uniref:Uncharacterized protein n=1 Tax=Streptomyces violaceusniger TaxID=68280 RepID=A0A4D4LPL9_STRVO|nr:hypothetical protein SVIO_104220 [Streptomyces violaceusniger]
MSSAQPVHSWDEPAGIAPRGTLVLLPGRGEHGGVYERFGRRIAADGYRVRTLGDASSAPEAVAEAATKLLRDETLPGPVCWSAPTPGPPTRRGSPPSTPPDWTR